MKGVHLLAVAAAVAVGGLSRSAYGAGSARLVYVRGNGAESCPDESAVRNAVAARVGYDPFFAFAPLTVIVDVHRRDDAFAARIQLVGEESRSLGSRELVSDSPSCESLIDAMSLAISIALDARSAERKPVVESAAPTPESLPAAPPVVDRDVVTPSPALHGPRPPRDVWTIGGGGGASLGETPAIAPSAFLYGAWRRAAISLGLEARATASGGESVPAGTVSAAAYSGSLVPCLHFGAAMFCAVTSVGWLRASGAAGADARNASALYLGVGPRVGFEVPLTERWSLRLHGDLVADLRRTTFRLNESDVWTAPVVYLALGAAVATHFP